MTWARRFWWVGVVVVMAACGGDSDDDAPTPTNLPETSLTTEAAPAAEDELRPAQEVRDEEVRADLRELGEVVELSDGIFGGLLAIEQRDDTTWAVTVRKENRTDAGSFVGDVEARCAGSEQLGFLTFDTDPEMLEQLPPDTFAEGVVVVAVPEGVESISDCVDPVIQLRAHFFMGDDVGIASWAAP
ncbi:MAG: hypothetical protein AAGA99_22420 [Actinomycetota bacterium]